MHDLAHYLKLQARALGAERSRLLRRAQIGNRNRVLDLGCGNGAVTGELVQRCRGKVIAADRSLAMLTHVGGEAGRIAADGLRLPFPAASIDLVFCQMLLLWVPELERLFAEVRRVLLPGGVFVIAAEPDYGGAIEFPEEAGLAPLWIAGLTRAGADPRVARRLPALARKAGFEIEARFHPGPPGPEQTATFRELDVEHLGELPLDPGERAQLERRAAARRAAGADLLGWIPTLGILARKL